MITPHDLIVSLPDSVRGPFLHWSAYLERHLTFSLADSELHTRGHCERVLLYALLIGDEVFGGNAEATLPLAHAAIFHDTRRRDDFLDVGHGAQAALYYRRHCETTRSLPFLAPAGLIMRYHDRDDSVGEQAIVRQRPDDAAQVVRLYRIFKDADALDRFRLGAEGLDLRFLRNRESLRWVEFARDLVQRTTRSHRP